MGFRSIITLLTVIISFSAEAKFSGFECKNPENQYVKLRFDRKKAKWNLTYFFETRIDGIPYDVSGTSEALSCRVSQKSRYIPPLFCTEEGAPKIRVDKIREASYRFCLNTVNCGLQESTRYRIEVFHSNELGGDIVFEEKDCQWDKEKLGKRE